MHLGYVQFTNNFLFFYIWNQAQRSFTFSLPFIEMLDTLSRLAIVVEHNN